jgi:ascorbate-specific PTS system EIIC-type component UlaA
MNFKQIIGLILIIIGAIVLIYALYARSRVSEVKKEIGKSSGLFSDNPVNKQIGQALEKKVGSYDMPIMVGMIGGIVLVIIGVGTMVYCRRR